MDKNTIIGFLLIGALLFGFAWLNQPSKEDIERQQHQRDSIAYVQREIERARQLDASTQVENTTAPTDSISIEDKNKDVYGAFAPSAVGENKLYTIENNLLRLKVSSKGGQIVSAELKDYKTGEGEPLILFDSEKDSTILAFNLVTANNRLIKTSDLYFQAVDFPATSIVDEGEQTFTFRLQTSEDAYLDYIYTLKADDYMIGFDLQAHQMEKVIPMSVNLLEMEWASKVKQQEKGRKFEDRYAALYYKFTSDDVENLSESKNDSESISTRVKWIAYKDQFFSTILIADDSFTGTKLDSRLNEKKSGYLKSYRADMGVSFDPTGMDKTGLRFYFGPNHYKTLHAYDKGIDTDDKLKIDKLVPLGWGIFGWINKYCVIPIFNWLGKYIGNFGIIILLLTIIIKLILFPMTYKSYMSTAKMRVLKPQIDEINERIPATKPQERQQATMALYRKVGVNPMSGCLPMLLQMPILFAMFSFFPASIELRQQSFLWASDLSSYDAIITWQAQIPLISEYFGNHLSLFCLLMTITNLVYTHINMKTTADASSQMPGMKWMMYLMPVMFLFIFNDYASGLSYYYFVATLITIAQTLIIRAFVDEDKILKKLHENAKNPKKQKKSGFMARLEEAQRQQANLRNQQAKKKK